jgi:hypothetical protein
MPSPFLGVWRDVSDTHDGYYLLTETHFCYFWAEKGRHTAVGQPTEQEAAALFRTMVGAAGIHSFTDQGGSWIHENKTQIATMPDSVGRTAKEQWTIDGNRSVVKDINADGSEGMTYTLEKIDNVGNSPFAGAWELINDNYEGMMLRTDTHYSAIVTRRNRPLPESLDSAFSGDPGKVGLDSEAAALFRAAQTAVVGKYTIDGMKTTTHTIVDRNPAQFGRESIREWRFEGDRALGAPIGGGEAVVWRKVG